MEEVVPSVNVQRRKLFPCKIGNVSQYLSLSLICASNISSLYVVPKMKLYNPLHRIFEVTRYDVWICQTALLVACDGNTSDHNRPKRRVCAEMYIVQLKFFRSENGDKSTTAFKTVTF